MSHLATMKLEVRDLNAVEAACKEMGLTFHRGQTTYKWWGRFEGDSPMPEGLTESDLGHCAHAISVPGTTWEIGLMQQATGYRVIFDWFGSQGKPILDAVGGKEAGKFMQLYGVHAASIKARQMGCMVSRSVGKNGNIELVMTGGGM